MDLEKAQKVIEKARALGGSPACKQLTASFEVFVDIYRRKPERGEDVAFYQELAEARRRFWKCMETVAEESGCSIASFQSQVGELGNSNPISAQPQSNLPQPINTQANPSETSNEPSAPKSKKRRKKERVKV